MNTQTEQAIYASLSPLAQQCVREIKANSKNVTSLTLIRLAAPKSQWEWRALEKELSTISNRSEILDFADEPNRNYAGKLLRKSSQNTWSYDPV